MHALFAVPDELSGPEPGESRKERVDRELRELLGEIRVALPGTELLLGFLLILPFSANFERLHDLGRALYLVCFISTAATVALFVSPTAQHRLGFRTVDKEAMLMRANRRIVAGLALLTLAITLAAYLVASVVTGSPWSIVIAAATACWFAYCWFAFPRPVSAASPSASSRSAAAG